MEVGHWNLEENKEKQKKATEIRKRASKIGIKEANNAYEKLDLVFKDRFCTKQEQINKYKQNDEKD